MKYRLDLSGGDATGEAVGRGPTEVTGGQPGTIGGPAKASGGQPGTTGGPAKASGGQPGTTGGPAKASGGPARTSTGDAPGEPSGSAAVDCAAGSDAGSTFERGSVFFVGNATVILRYAGFTILTDPNFLHEGEHAHLGYGLRTRRRVGPAIGLDDLPPDLDAVLLSHYHGDHFDRRVEAGLDRSVPILTTHHAAERLADAGFEAVYPLATWETARLVRDGAHLDVTATPARHGPPVVEKALPEVMGSVLEFAPAGGDVAFRQYVSGDTVLYRDLAEIPRRFPTIDLALLHLGGTRVLGVLLTMDAEQGVEAVRLVDADVTIPIHTDDYDVFRSPRSEFREAVARAGLEDRVTYLDRGDAFEFEVPERRLA